MSAASSRAMQPQFNAPLGLPPSLEWLAIEDLWIDPAYQRSLEAGASQTLIRRIAANWDWRLCQPLAVSRRADGKLTIVDGQHRATAARRRGDIPQLPCVITAYADFGAEAAAFVALNQQRRPLSRLEIFKAALASGDMESAQINIALEAAGLRLATSTNLGSIGPGSLSNVRGLQRCYRAYGLPVLETALKVIAQAYPGEVMQYAGSIFPGVEAIVAGEIALDAVFAEGERFTRMLNFVGATSQKDWYSAVSSKTGEHPTRNNAAAALFRERWVPLRNADIAPPEPPAPEQPPAPKPPAPQGLSFEEQVARVERGEVGIAPVFKPRRPDPEGTLGGVATGML